MTDTEFTKLLQRCAKAGNKYLELYQKAEKEYERRFGVNPSDVDDDEWLDALALSCGKCTEGLTASEIEERH